MENTSFQVKTGSTVLASQGFSPLRGRTVGFLGNHTSQLSDGESTVTAIIQSGHVKVVSLFSPEHGAFGLYDAEIVDELDTKTGLNIYSLYGEHRKPTAEMLQGVDCLVFELQDVGARFYTYCATLLHAIDAAYENNIEIVVLDRPNPISGARADGPVADSAQRTFVAPYSIPIRTGLTLGELATLYVRETDKESILRVIPMSGWKRDLYYDDTGLSWTAPSPAMLSLDTAVIYTGACLLEQTNVSVGRGTESPFETLGAPFIDADAWYDRLNKECLAGVDIAPVKFIPRSSKYAMEVCGGITLTVTNRNIFHPVHLGIHLLTSLRDLYGATFELKGASALLANADVLELLLSGADATDIISSWQCSLSQWKDRAEIGRIYR